MKKERISDLEEMVHPERFERPTYWFVASCSIQLSYGCTAKSERQEYNEIK